jgi:hypothetical protein
VAASAAAHLGPAWMVLQATSNTDMATAKANGATHAFVAPQWASMQTTAGGPVDVSAIQAQIDQAIALGLKICLRVAPQYIPTFVDTAAVKFRRNGSVDWTGANITGDATRDYVWSASTRALLDDWLTKLFNQLNWTQIERVQLGGLIFGELSYPTTDGTQWWGFSAPAQTGTDLASGQVVCPVPGYTPSTGTTWVANDTTFVNWYRDSLNNFLTWLIGRHRAFFNGPIWVLHPGSGLRPVSQTPTSSGQALNYRKAVAAGTDWGSQIGAYPDANVHPYSTWGDANHFWPPDPFSDTNDGNAAPWYHLLRVARAAGRANRIWGENTGSNTNTDMDRVFTDGAVAFGYQGFVWLSHSTLTSSTNDTYANWLTRITKADKAFNGGLYSRGVNMAGAEFAADAAHLPGTYSVDYAYDDTPAINSMAARGHKIIRVPFRWERIQPTRNAALDAAELARLTAVVDAVTAAGMRCVLDVHNYARYIPSGGSELVLGTDIPAADLANLWSRLSTAFKDKGLYGYGLMNEPHDLVGTTGSFSGVIRYDWNAGTVAGWTGDAATASNVGNKLHLVASVTTGYSNFRKDDAGTLAGGTLTGNTLQAVITLGSGASGNWKAILQWQTAAFVWQTPTSTTYTRVDTGAVVSGLIANVAVTVRATWAGGINTPHAFAIQIEANDATAGTVSADIDDFAQGTLAGSLTPAQVWESIAQQCVTAIRATGDVTKIMIPGYGFSGAQTWTTNHPTPWITDPADNHAYEAHYYFDVDNSGDYPDTYATENSAAVAAGYSNLSSRVARELSSWLRWLVANGVRGFLGETGWTHTESTASWNAVGETLYDEADRYALDVAYWSAGARWGTGYNLSAYTGTNQNTLTAQASIIEAHPSVTGAGITVPPPVVAPTTSATELRTNLSPNPALKTTVSGPGTSWASSPAGYVRQSAVTGMDRTTGFGGTGAIDFVTTPRFAAVAGQSYVASVQIKTGAANSFKMLINWYQGTPSGGTFISGSATTSFTVNGTQRVEVGPLVAPAGAGAGYLRIIDLDNTAVTLTAVLVEKTSSTGRVYFDGDTTSPAASWAGTAGNSTSYQLTASDAWAFTDAGSRAVTASGPTAGDTASFSESASIVASSVITEYVTWSDSAMIVSCDYDPRRGRNRISARGLPTAGVRAIVESRKENRSAWLQVRGGKVGLSGGAFVRTVDDYEFAAGQATTYRIRVLSTPENVAEVTISSVTVTLPATNPGVWLKFIVQPALNQQVQLIDWGEIARPTRITLYDVVGRTDPVAVTDVHGSRRITVTLRTSTNDEAERLDDALSQGRPLFLHVPANVALPSVYAVAGDYAATRPSKTTPVRYWQVALIEVSPPPASAVAPATTWQNILDSYGTWQDVINAFPTWQDVVS